MPVTPVTLVNPYCTLEQVQRFLGNTDGAKVDQIKDAINRASRFIDSMTGQVFYKKTISDYYLQGGEGGDGWLISRVIPGRTGGGLIFCRYKPIIEITALYEGGTLLAENTDYYLRKDDGIIERADGANWSATPRDIKISGSFGYNAASSDAPASDIPQDIQEFTKEIAGRLSGLYSRSVEQADGSVDTFSETTIPKWMVDRIVSRAARI